MRKKCWMIWSFILLLIPGLVFSQDMPKGKDNASHNLGNIVVTGKNKTEPIVQTPSQTIIDLDDYQIPGNAQNISDIIKGNVAIDFRGKSDLVPDDDTLYLRGFDSSRFVTALDGLTIQKTGGRKSSHIVDYALLPTFLIKQIEILPGPHSVLYPGKSIGGVVNLTTKEPYRHNLLKPEFEVSTGFRSYNTQNHTVSMKGSVDAVTYDLAVQKYMTDGFLRNGKADIETLFTRIGYILPSDGYITLSASYNDSDREIPVNNDPMSGNHDNDHPEVTTSAFDPWQKPTWDKEASSYRLNFKHATGFGTWSGQLYTSKENRERNYWDYINKKNPDQGIQYTEWETIWWQNGGRLQDRITISDNHALTLGGDFAQLYDNGSGSKKKRVAHKAAFLEHRWDITADLDMKWGLRYENVGTWVQNYSQNPDNLYISGRDPWIKRDWNQVVPKSFLTYKLDRFSKSLRDTSLSLGISKIWHAPDYHGVYNGQGKPSGAWLDPEHGIGYDLVFSRRLFNDVNLKVNYSYSEIKDYIASNKNYSKYWPRRGAVVPPGLEYKDYKINLEKMVRQGVEVELQGKLLEDLSFYLGYAFQDFDSKGGEPAGEEAADQRARHRVNAGIRYALFDNTTMMLDYEYQSKQVTEKSEEIAPDVWDFNEIHIDAFNVFDLAVQQVLFKNWHGVKDASLKVYVNNLLDEEYVDSEGYTATDRTFGTALTFSF